MRGLQKLQKSALEVCNWQRFGLLRSPRLRIFSRPLLAGGRQAKVYFITHQDWRSLKSQTLQVQEAKDAQLYPPTGCFTLILPQPRLVGLYLNCSDYMLSLMWPIDWEMTVEYMKNSLKRDGPEMERICASAAKHGTAVSLGYSENDDDSLYLSQSFISKDGVVKMNRRKIKPTHVERILYGHGSGASLMNVVEEPRGVDLATIR